MKYPTEALGANGSMMLKLILGGCVWGLKRINLAHDRSSWWAVMNTVMNIRIPLAERTITSQEGRSTME